MVAMEDAGFIIGSYVLILGGVGAYAAGMIRRARQLSKRVPDEEKPWT